MTRFFRCFCLVLLLVIAVLPLGLHAQDSTPVGKLPIAKLQELADSGDPAAENELGVRYRVGTDVDKDPAKAIPWFLKAARQGYPKAYFNLGAAYYNGDAVSVSDEDACVWFTLAADAGDQRGIEAVARTQQEFTPAQMTRCELLAATAYQSGERVEQDYGKALQWYKKAADNKDGLACERLAYMYQRGLGVAADLQESLKWLKRSADLGYVPAIYDMAYMYDKGGMGLPQDITKAKRMYETAAADGQLEALLALGGMYRDGRGAKLDRQVALSFYLAAAELGSPDGKSIADKLSAELTPKQISAAQTEAKRIKAQSRSQLALIKK